MPRKARIDSPGALHHIMVCGIEKCDIFYDDHDRDIFVQKKGNIISESKTCCLAWALMPNHDHILARTGLTPISVVMQRFLTLYSSKSIASRNSKRIYSVEAISLYGAWDLIGGISKSLAERRKYSGTLWQENRSSATSLSRFYKKGNRIRPTAQPCWRWIN